MPRKSEPQKTRKFRQVRLESGARAFSRGRHITDLSKRRSLKDALEQSETRFALFMEHMPAAAFIKDLNGRYVYFSPTFADFAGRAPGLRPGTSDEENWPEFARRLREEDQVVIQTGQTVTAEDCRTDGDDTRYFQTVKFPIPDKQGRTALIGGISVDITARMEAERERQALLEKLSQAQEEERWRISRELHDDLTQRLGTLAIDIGRIAGAESAVREAASSVAALAAAAVWWRRPKLRATWFTSCIRWNSRTWAWWRRCDRTARISRGGRASRSRLKSRDVPKRLKREIGSCVYKVAKESLSNVAMHAEAERVSVILEGARDVIRLSVKDSGIGFTAGTPGAEGGIGLLSMKARVALVGGNIDIRSQPGPGYGGEGGASVGVTLTRRSRILLGDDHGLILAGARSLLDAHYEVVGQLGDGRSLVAAALRLRPDLVILDISMPVMNGIDAARQIRKGWPEVKLLFLSMHSSPVYLREAMDAGGAGYVIKSAANEELRIAVEQDSQRAGLHFGRRSTGRLSKACRRPCMGAPRLPRS